MQFIITLTDAEYKALASVAVSPEDWINNAVHERCRIAIEEIVAAEVQRITALPDVRERLTTLGAEPSSMTPADFGQWLKSEIPAMAKIVKDEKITAE